MSTKIFNPTTQKILQEIVQVKSDAVGHEVRIEVLRQKMNQYKQLIQKWPESILNAKRIQKEIEVYQETLKLLKEKLDEIKKMGNTKSE